MKIKESIWYNAMGSIQPIGIVLGLDEKMNVEKAYIGFGHGHDQAEDERLIIEGGAKFPAHIAKLLIEGG